MRQYLFLILLFIIFADVDAQRQHIDAVVVGEQYGFVFPHTPIVQNTASSRPLIFFAGMERIYTDTNYFDIWHCLPRQGFFLKYTDFQLPILGQCFIASYYLQPDIKLSGKISAGLRAETGVAWANNPFSITTNPGNQSYSSNTNAYLCLGFHSGILLIPRWELMAGLQLNHISNGGWDKPNKGVNWITSGITLKYSFHNWKLPDYSKRIPLKTIKKIRTEISTFGSYSMYNAAERNLYTVYGASLLASYYGKLSGWTLGTELVNDGALKSDSLGIKPSPILFSVMFGHEFKIGKFIFSQQLGIYLFKETSTYNYFYHRWGLVYYPLKRFGFGVNLKVHNETANFLDARIVYVLKN